MVTPVLVTRGDVPMDEIVASVRVLGEPVIWDNSREENLLIFGQYKAAMERVTTEWVYFQDDDVITDPAAIFAAREPGVIVCNMPEAHRCKHIGDVDSLMGFGSVFQRDMICETLDRYFQPMKTISGRYLQRFFDDEVFRREIPRIFTMLNRTKWVDIPKRDMPWATAPNRMYHQPEHAKTREEARRRCRLIREAVCV